MGDAELLERNIRTLHSSVALMTKGALDSRLVRLGGVSAAVVPATPGRSVLNSVVYDSHDQLAAALDDLAAAYEEAGVYAWTVWVPERDRESAQLLREAGHVLDAAPLAMGMELDRLGPPPGLEPEWTGDWSRLADAALVNDRAYGDPDGTWAAALGGLPEGIGHLYLADLDGEAASFVMVQDHEDDCDFWFAATIPAARGRGLVSGLLHRALSDARERGCRTTTTQATAMGAPVYERIGYRSQGALEMWERRKPAPGG